MRRKVLFILTIFQVMVFSLNAIQKEIVVTDDFKSINVKDFASIFTSDKKIEVDEFLNHQFISSNKKSFFYFPFDKKTIWIKFTITNNTNNNQELLLRFSNSMIYEIIGYKIENQEYQKIFKTGIAYSSSNKEIRNRNFVNKIVQKAKETSTYLLSINKKEGRPLVSDIVLQAPKVFERQIFIDYILLGVYSGLCVICLIVGCYFFFLFKKRLYLFYVLYIVSLYFFTLSYSGVFQQYFLAKEIVLNKYLHYVVFSELILVFFVLFALHFYKTKESSPKLHKTISYFVVLSIVLRILLHYFFNDIFTAFIPTFMKLWYLIVGLVIILISYIIIKNLKKRNTPNNLFALAYFCIGFGCIYMVLYHSYGLIDGMIVNLPVLLFASVAEFLLLLLALLFTVKNEIRQKSILIIEVAKEQQKNSKEFILLSNKTKVYLEDLKYVKSDGNYVEFYTREKKILDRNKLKTISEQLPSNFVRVHKSYIVNKNYIKSLKSTSINLKEDIEIPLSRHYKKMI